MSFVSIEFYLFLAVVVILYYIMPLRMRWYALLGGSVVFFLMVTDTAGALLIFVGLIVASWFFGLLLDRDCRRISVDKSGRRLILGLCIIVVLFPLLLSKISDMFGNYITISFMDGYDTVIPLGLSFYTLQMVSYLVDIHRGKIRAQRHFLKYVLFISFFPQIVQGPIPRYDQLEPQLVEGHRFDANGIRKGFMGIIWGFFLKMMIADKAGIVVDTIFADPELFQGAYVVVGGVLYSVQLYADFLACIALAKGFAELFGIELAENFCHPYYACSIKEFWGGWHMSLSSWLRDYVYIPLGGNRKGTLRKYCNLILTFIVSGLWHGAGFKYLLWGMMHAGYEIVGECTQELRDAFFGAIQIPEFSRKRRWIRRCSTFLLVTVAWVIFRADTLRMGLSMLRSLFCVYNPWIFFDDSLLALGLGWKEWGVLILSILILIQADLWQMQFSVRDRILAQPVYLRCGICIMAVLIILVFGTYGYGYNAADFIYGGF